MRKQQKHLFLNMKRALCILLSAALLSTAAFSASAEDTETDLETYPYLYIDNLKLGCSVLVVSYDAMYDTVGDETAITVSYTRTTEDGTQENENCVLSIGADDIRRDVLTGEDGLHPQLFVRLPGFLGDGDRRIPKTATLSVGEGVFKTSDGTLSPALELTLSRFAYRSVNVSIYSRNVTEYRHVLVNTEIYVTTMMFGKSVRLWDENAKWYMDGVPVGNEIMVSETGNHSVYMVLNDFVFTQPNGIYAITRREARRDQLQYFTDECKMGLTNILLSSSLFVLMPFVSIGSVVGSFASITEGTALFFYSLFALHLYSAWNFGVGFSLLGLDGRWTIS